MKNQLFNKATALVMGSLMVFSGQALAIKSNNHKIIDAEALNNSEIVIAQQDTGRACAQVQVGVAILDQIITALEDTIFIIPVIPIYPREEIPPEFRDELKESLREAIKAFAEALGIAEKDKNKELVITITTVIGVLDNVAEAIANGKVGQVEVLKGVKAEAERACQFQ